MRTRSRTLPFDWGADKRYYGNSAGIITPSWVCSPTSPHFMCRNIDCIACLLKGDALGTVQSWVTPDWYGDETIIDVTSKERRDFNPVDHWIYKGFSHSVSAFCSNYSGSRTAMLQNHRWLPTYVWVIDKVLKHPSIDLSNARRSAWHSMQPRFEGNVSMLNFLYELKDFKSLGRSLMNHPIDRIAKSLRRALAKQRAGKLHFDPSKSIAEAHLANEFALKPLIKDIFDISNQLKLMIDELQDQFAAHGEDNTSYYRETYIHDQSLSETNLYYRAGTQYKTVFNATMDYSYVYTVRSRWDAMQRYWGLVPTAEAIWNGIPFSFLVDYFVRIGKTLSLMRHDPNVSVTPAHYGESLTTSRTTGIFVQPMSEVQAAIINREVCLGSLFPITGTRSALYTRYHSWPDFGPVAPVIRMPSSKQGLNILALARCFLSGSRVPYS